MKDLFTEILRDFYDYSLYYMVDEEIYAEFAQRISNALNQPCGLTTQDAYKRYDLNKSVIIRGQKELFLNDPLSYGDKIFFDRLKSFWAKSWFLRAQIRRHCKEDRQRLLDAPEFEQKWERQVYYWYFSQDDGVKDEAHQYHKYSQLPVKVVINALHNFYPSLFDEESNAFINLWNRSKVLNPYEMIDINGTKRRINKPWPKRLFWLKSQIKTIRNKAQHDRYELKKRGKSSEEILALRGIKKTDLSTFENLHKKIAYEPATGLKEDIIPTNDKPRY